MGWVDTIIIKISCCFTILAKSFGCVYSNNYCGISIIKEDIWAALLRKKVRNVLSRCHTKRRTGVHPSFFWYDTDFSKEKKNPKKSVSYQKK